MQSSRHAFTMLRCVVVSLLLAVVVASCGSAAPSDLLLPHTVAMSDSDSSVGPAPDSGAPDASDMPAEDASPRDVGPPRDASPCNADTCANGCCNSDGRCLLGTDDSACGSGGVACGSCMDLGQMCSQGVCVSTTPPEDAGCDPMTCPAKCGFLSMPCCNMMGACSCVAFGRCP